MKKYVEEAIIIEVYEEDPDFGVETVIPEIIKPKQKKVESFGGLFGSLFDFFINDPFEQILTDLGIYESDPEPEREAEVEEKEDRPLPELAMITDSNENYVREFRYFYYEIENL